MVRAAPLLPRSSFSTWTMTSWPSLITSLMLMRLPGLTASGVEIAAGDFLQRQEAVALGAVVDESGLEAGLDPGDLALVDVGLFLLPAGGFDIEIEQLLAVDDRHAQLFRLSCVDQHSFHVFLSRNTARTRAAARPQADRGGAGSVGFAARCMTAPRDRAGPVGPTLARGAARARAIVLLSLRLPARADRVYRTPENRDVLLTLVG